MTRVYAATRWLLGADEFGLEVTEADNARPGEPRHIYVHDFTRAFNRDQADRQLWKWGFRRVSEWDDWPEDREWESATVELLDPNAGLFPGDGRDEIVRLCEVIIRFYGEPHPELADWQRARDETARALHELLGATL